MNDNSRPQPNPKKVPTPQKGLFMHSKQTTEM